MGGEIIEFFVIKQIKKPWLYSVVSKGDRVGACIKDTIKYKREKGIEKRYPTLEHLWIKISGKNKNNNLLLGTFF